MATAISLPPPSFPLQLHTLSESSKINPTWGVEEPGLRKPEKQQQQQQQQEEQQEEEQQLLEEQFDGTQSVFLLGAGDSYLIHNFLPKEVADEAFAKLKPSDNSEVNYHQMYHMTRRDKKAKPSAIGKALSRVKGIQVSRDVATGATPLYRYSVNNQCQYCIDDFSPTVQSIQSQAEKATKQTLNHAVILCYRDGADCIGFHQDKLLDIKKGSDIISVSLGAERPFLLQSPDKKHVQHIILPHGSLFCLGAKTNETWFHSLPPLNCPNVGMRIAVTLRDIATFFDSNGVVFGQGDQYQTHNWPFGEHLSRG